ncbi:NmrA family NAD(P)-binding protein [Sphingomonas lenta]|uniref:NmrA-like domain-containing protein n=1 Tax=Sphingomonas lenta TaxID=1141887 RepID=A0A2A2SE92_9SPHN|nr:NmrA family NAD(P)-binding protein [Sphingomonas lenta]PAX07533.1 hypothetical protein CKY28_07680 [Sphingomonas lenta]
MILVTGASRTVGGAVLAALREQGAPAVAATSRADALRPDQRRLDFADPTSFAPALDGVRTLFLMLPPALPRARERFRALLATAKARGVERVAFLSIRNADRLPMLPHRGLERVVEASGLGWTHLRANDFMQNFATVPVYRDGIRRGELVGPGGRSYTAYVDVRDIGEATARILLDRGHDGRAYTLTGPDPLTLPEVATALGEVLGRPVAARTPSLPGFFRHARRVGAPVPLALIMTSIGLIARLGLAAGVDPTLERLLARRPRDIRDFARAYSAAWA